jgi:hypothetical protein
MTVFPRIPIAIALALVLPVAAFPQSPLPTVPVDSGREVRAHLPSEVVRGRLLIRYVPGDSSMHLCVYPAWRCGGGGDASIIRELRTHAMLRLEVQRGTEAEKGAIIGGVIGGLLGGFTGMMAAAFSESSRGATPAQGAFFGVLGGAALVGLLGYGIGHSLTRWGPAP